MTRLFKAMTDHPRSVGESYFEHMGVAAGFGWRLLGASLAAFVHALLPFAFERTASRTILGMADTMHGRVPATAKTVEPGGLRAGARG